MSGSDTQTVYSIRKQAMSNRDEFRKSDVEALAKRVGGRCSNPGCRQATTGPKTNPGGSINIGVAAHITAAAPGGARHDPSLSAEQRRSIENGIWLCQNCGKLVDSDSTAYSVALLRTWKTRAEENAKADLEGIQSRDEALPTLDVIMTRRDDRITGARHDYRLEVSIRNLGAGVFRGYHADLQFPTRALIGTEGRIEERSDSVNSLFRRVWKGDADDVFPDDQKLIFDIPYYMDENLFGNRAALFDLVVRVTLFEGNRRHLLVEQRFGDLQIY
jgi:hypothetical protein